MYFRTETQNVKLKCASCNGKRALNQLRKCRTCGHAHCLFCDGIGGNVDLLCPVCGSSDVLPAFELIGTE